MKKTKLLFLLLSVAILTSTLLPSCSEDDDNNSTPAATDDLSVSKFTATIDGVNVSYIVNGTTLEGVSGSSKEINPPSPSYFSYDFSIWNNDTEKNIIMVSKGRLSPAGYNQATTSEFCNFIKVGSENYSNDALNGIEIKCYINGEVWTTTGIAQTGSLFNFISVKYPVVYTQYANFKANFNCKLTNGIGTKTLTNGVLIGSFENQ